MKSQIRNYKVCLAPIVFAVIALQIFSLAPSVSAVPFSENITDPATQASSSFSSFLIQTVKYEPYPVNAGDYFDVWILAINNGQQDAHHVTFQLAGDYPFSSLDNIRQFDIVPGITNAYNNLQPGELTAQSNQVLLKFHAKADPTASAGDYNLKLLISYSTNAISATTNNYSFNLPISIANTKTDFEVVMQDSSTQGTTFAIANTGQNIATAVIVSLSPSPELNATGQSSILGNLDSGDSTTATFQIGSGSGSSSSVRFSRNMTSSFNSQNQSSPRGVTIQISYTDTAGVRNTIQKVVPINIGASASASRTAAASAAAASAANSNTKYYYLVAGLVAGGVIMYFINRRKIKR